MNFAAFAQAVKANAGHVIVGKEAVTELLLVTLLVEGHALLEDVPGIGKTTLAKALSRSLDLSFARIQFTPDLLPSDVTGINYYNQKRQEFEFRPGPTFSQLLLADEINRATPRTQSALLEAMQERQVTVDGQTYPLPRPFMVLATQNPIELEGTFPLPEAQVDRFLAQIRLGYPTEAQEEEILLRYQSRSLPGGGQPGPLASPAGGQDKAGVAPLARAAEPGRAASPGDDLLAELRPVASTEDVLELQRGARQIHVSADVRHYIAQVARATREHQAVDLGVSPRGTLALFKASQALAALRGRDYVIPSDVQTLCAPVLTHRVHISPQVRLRGRTPAQIITEITESVPVPVVE
jgi:MoxR-like ATPase